MKYDPKNRADRAIRMDRPIRAIIMNLEILNRTRKWIAAGVVWECFLIRNVRKPRINRSTLASTGERRYGAKHRPTQSKTVEDNQ